MRRHAAVLTIAALLLGRVPLHADSLLLDRFGDYLESLRAQAGIPGLSAAVVGQREILWERAFGRQNVERSIATRTDTPFHLDAMTQVFTAALVLRCVEEGRLSLDDRVGRFLPSNPDANATIRELLTHTTGTDNPTFAYRPERLAPLTPIVRACAGNSFRETLANLIEQLAMVDSVPGPDVIHIRPPAEGIPTAAAVGRYTSVLARLATPYAVDQLGRASTSKYVATTMTPASGLVSTVRDFAKFDLALRNGVLVRPETLAAAWRPSLGRDGRPLPHGLGWFVQTYNGEPIAWQLGVGESASSALVVTAPARGLTFVLLANSDGIVKSFGLTGGDLTASPFGRLFLDLFVR